MLNRVTFALIACLAAGYSSHSVSSSETNPHGPDRNDRTAVALWFYQEFHTAFDTFINWTGDDASCDPGNTSVEYEQDTLQAVNYFRSMVSLPPVTLDPASSAKNRDSALMVRVNQSTNHNPGANSTCFTADGQNAARNSNLALGVAGPHAVRQYIEEPGANATVGHRRYLLNPRLQSIGTGSTINSNSMWIRNTSVEHPGTPEFVAWPPDGYVPYTIVYRRWSLSIAGADFSNATVSLTKDDVSIPTQIVSVTTTTVRDNTIVFEPGAGYGPITAQIPDTDYRVVIDGVANAPRSRYEYVVRVFDPLTEGPDPPDPPPNPTEPPDPDGSNQAPLAIPTAPLELLLGLAGLLALVGAWRSTKR